MMREVYCIADDDSGALFCSDSCAETHAETSSGDDYQIMPLTDISDLTEEDKCVWCGEPLGEAPREKS